MRGQRVVGTPAGNAGARVGGWFRRRIRSVDDLKGLTSRIAGHGGIAPRNPGLVPQPFGCAEIDPALERGAGRLPRLPYAVRWDRRTDSALHAHP